MNFTTAFIANSQAAKLMQPRQRPFHNPAIFAQAAAMFGPSSVQHRLYPKLVQNLSLSLRIIRTVALNTFWPLKRSPAKASNFWNRFNQRQKLRAIVAIIFGEFYSQRVTASICNHEKIIPPIPSIRCIRSRFSPPKPPAPIRIEHRGKV